MGERAGNANLVEVALTLDALYGVSTNLRLDAGILSYSRSKGLFAGLELKGAVINPDNNLNEALYGLKAKDVLTGANKIKMADVLPGVIVFPNTLARYSIK